MDSGVAFVGAAAAGVAVEEVLAAAVVVAVVELVEAVGAAVAAEVGGGCWAVLGSAAGRLEGATELVAGTGAATLVVLIAATRHTREHAEARGRRTWQGCDPKEDNGQERVSICRQVSCDPVLFSARAASVTVRQRSSRREHSERCWRQ